MPSIEPPKLNLNGRVFQYPSRKWKRCEDELPIHGQIVMTAHYGNDHVVRPGIGYRTDLVINGDESWVSTCVSPSHTKIGSFIVAWAKIPAMPRFVNLKKD